MEKICEEIVFLSKAPEDIVEKCIIRLYNFLREINLDSMSLQQRLLFLVKLVDVCRSNNASKKVVDAILKRWEAPFTEDLSDIMYSKFDADGILGDLAATTLCGNNNLRFLASLYEYNTPMTVLESHVRNRVETGMSFEMVAERIFDAYGISNMEDYEWDQIIRAIDETKIIKTAIQIERIIEYIHLKISELEKSKVAKKPEWVTLNEGETREQYKDSFIGASQEELAKNALVIKEFLDTHPSKQKDEEGLTTEEVSKMSLSLCANTADNVSYPIERVYGPANAIIGFDCVSSPRKENGERVGPCRMLTCLCRELNEEDEEIDFDEYSLENPESVWFSGHCLICKKSIKKARYAVRYPNEGGGWEGCFCSFECMKDVTYRPVEKIDIYRMEEVEELLKTYGIADF